MIALIDPALQDHAGTPSTNLGDVVIFRAISRCFEALFPGEKVCRISSHEPLEERHYDLLARSRLIVLGGSNLLSSDVLAYNQWNFTASRSSYEMPRFGNAVLFGIGWWQYQDPPTPFTADFYRRVLTCEGLHSVRDGYTATRLKEAGITNVVNTGCPSIWTLDGLTSNRRKRWSEDCLVTVTDYYTNPADDEAFLRLVLDRFKGSIFLFPQGTGDVEYVDTLECFKCHRRRFQILDHSLDRLHSFLDSNRINYVGTRLHGGITALTHRVPSLILAVDNRAAEMGKSFHLPVVGRRDLSGIDRWLRGEELFEPISVPKADILRWLKQFQPNADFSAVIRGRP